jgi:hypothetical protein
MVTSVLVQSDLTLSRRSIISNESDTVKLAFEYHHQHHHYKPISRSVSRRGVKKDALLHKVLQCSLLSAACNNIINSSLFFTHLSFESRWLFFAASFWTRRHVELHVHIRQIYNSLSLIYSRKYRCNLWLIQSSMMMIFKQTDYRTVWIGTVFYYCYLYYRLQVWYSTLMICHDPQIYCLQLWW